MATINTTYFKCDTYPETFVTFLDSSTGLGCPRRYLVKDPSIKLEDLKLEVEVIKFSVKGVLIYTDGNLKQQRSFEEFFFSQEDAKKYLEDIDKDDYGALIQNPTINMVGELDSYLCKNPIRLKIPNHLQHLILDVTC